MKTNHITKNNIDFNYNYNIKSTSLFKFNLKKISLEILDYILKDEKIKTPCNISLTIVDNKTIKKINKQERNINKITDVLSFPLIDYNIVKNIDKYIYKHINKYIDFYDYDKNCISLGDIVISCDKIISQSEKYNHSKKREFSFLVAHSIYHLLGYDHMNKKDENIMFEKQKKCLDNLGICR